MIGAPAQSKDGNGIINEDMASLDELLNKLVDTDEVYPEEQEDYSDEEMIGAPAQSKDGNGIINEDMASLDELLNKLVDTDEVYPEEQED